MENLEVPFSEIFTDLVNLTKLDDYASSCQYKNPLVVDAAEKILALINESELQDEKASILNHITGKYLLSLHKSYMEEFLKTKTATEEDAEADEEEFKNETVNPELNNTNLHFIFTLIDLSLYIDETYKDYHYAMHTFVIILSYLYPIDFIIKSVAPFLFNENGKKRLLLLTKGNKLQGKVKPGSRLLVIYKQLINRIPTFEAGNEEFIAKFRHFISNSLEISDKLTQSSDWHMANTSVNGYYSSFENFYNLKKYNTISSAAAKNDARNVFTEYITLNKTLTTSSESELILAMNKGFNLNSNQYHSSAHHNNAAQMKLWTIENINKSLNNISYHDARNLNKIPLNNITEKQFKWVLDESTFYQQLRTYDFFYALKLQLAILSNFFNESTFDRWKKDSEQIMSEYSKFGKPESFSNPITSIEAKRRVSDWYVYSLNGFKQKNYHHLEILNLLEKNEKTFQKMKLKNFVHPEIDQLNQISESKKRKVEEYIAETDDLDAAVTSKKPRFAHALGTPKITKLWNVEKTTPWKDSEDILESVKDDIYFARGSYEENPKDEASAETFHRLCWKGLRSVKESGNWLKLATTNEKGQLESETCLF